jgi:hypothetical protein
MLAAKINTHSKHSNTEWAKRITIDLFVHIYLLMGAEAPVGLIFAIALHTLEKTRFVISSTLLCARA